METQERDIIAHLLGEQPVVEVHSAIADTFAGRIHVEWDQTVPVTPFGQLPFFIDYLKQAGLFDAWVADCPLSLSSPNAPSKRDLLGTVMLSVLVGHRRYAHITALRCDAVNPSLLGMRKLLSEDSVRRGLATIGAAKGLPWLQTHLDYCSAPLLGEPWVLDMDSMRIPTKPATDSAANRPPVPIKAGQAFRRKPAGGAVRSEGSSIPLSSPRFRQAWPA